MRTKGYVTIIVLFLVAATVFAFQTGNQADNTSPVITPASGSNTQVTSTITAPAAPLAQDDEAAALIWEGDPLPDDNQEDCRSLRLTVAGQAMIGPCGAAETSVDMAAGLPGG